MSPNFICDPPASFDTEHGVVPVRPLFTGRGPSVAAGGSSGAAGGSSAFDGRGPSAFAGRDRSVAAGGSSAFDGRGPSAFAGRDRSVAAGGSSAFDGRDRSVAAGGSSAFAGRGPSAFAGRDRSVAAGGSSAFAGRGPSVAAEPSVPASVSPKHSFADVTGRGVPAPVNKFKAVGNLPWVPRNDINRLIEACGCNNRVWDNEPIVNFPESELMMKYPTYWSIHDIFKYIHLGKNETSDQHQTLAFFCALCIWQKTSSNTCFQLNEFQLNTWFYYHEGSGKLAFLSKARNYITNILFKKYVIVSPHGFREDLMAILPEECRSWLPAYFAKWAPILMASSCIWIRVHLDSVNSTLKAQQSLMCLKSPP